MSKVPQWDNGMAESRNQALDSHPSSLFITPQLLCVFLKIRKDAESQRRLKQLELARTEHQRRKTLHREKIMEIRRGSLSCIHTNQYMHMKKLAKARERTFPPIQGLYAWNSRGAGNRASSHQPHWKPHNSQSIV